MVIRIALALVVLVLSVATADLCETCNGHGVCNPTTRLCQCMQGYTGNRCEFASCPTGLAWADYAIATDTAHQLAVCSNMGLCDPTSGLCVCRSGFEGPACEYMSCPPCQNGRCISLRDAAQSQDDVNFFTTTTYSLWDADKILGCQCDYGFSGYDCSQRSCPVGDDPLTTGQFPEVQQLSCLCNGCTGSFVLSYQGFYTVNISPTATAATLQTAINNLIPIQGVTVTLSGSGSTVCDSDGAVSSITFTKNGGNVPSLRVTNLLTGGTSAISIQSSGATGLYDSVAATYDGTTESAVCSNRGLCNPATGLCLCQPGFGSSDGAGNAGTIPDCGHQISATTCPLVSGIACNGQGTCSAATQYKCVCNAGFKGMDCSQRICPLGIAWFDGPTAQDKAHAMAVCSNKGTCNPSTGLCACATGFTGAACELLSCPGSPATCNGQGQCKTMQQLAQLASINGAAQGFTYGNTPNLASTWDFNKIQGCACSQHASMGPFVGSNDDFIAYDCSFRACPTGADPYETGKIDEQQTITCTADGGFFTLSFRQYTTASISASANLPTVQAALQALPTIVTATVTFSTGSTVCSTSGVVTTIIFTYAQGPLPLIVASSGSLTLSGSAAPPITVTETVVGTKANAECSRRGSCNRATGACQCYDGFYSSDGNGNPGTRGDCGYISPYKLGTTSTITTTMTITTVTTY
ncbi:hypothetical protein AeNC1_010962 [Aphanomyces euteiches]|nr:hypothetical protein AeNC1_010962 [Aphanomyces euteiches]